MLSKHQIPNLLTYARVAAVPVALALMMLGNSPVLLFWLFTAASITDFFDGYLARKWHCTSTIGTLLDPVADKLLVALLLLYLLTTGSVAMLPVIIILLREIYVSGLREFLASRAITLPVSKGGKWKTASQMLGIANLLLGLGYAVANAFLLGTILIWVAAILAASSAIHYTRAVWPHLK